MTRPEMKTAILLSNAISAGVAANSGIHLATQLGAARQDIAGDPVSDQSGFWHSGLPVFPNVVLSVSPEKLRKAIHRAKRLANDDDLLILDYPEQGFTTSTDEEYRREIEAMLEDDIVFYGALIFGPRRLVDKALKGASASLWNGAPEELTA